MPKFSDDSESNLLAVLTRFDVDGAAQVKDIEKTTNHDVKAISIFSKTLFRQTLSWQRPAIVHFACTSEDINNPSHALMLRDGIPVIASEMRAIISGMKHSPVNMPSYLC